VNNRVRDWLGLVALAGCATGGTETAYDPTRPHAASPAAADLFPYAHGVAFSNHVIAEEETTDYVVRFIAIPSTGGLPCPRHAISPPLSVSGRLVRPLRRARYSVPALGVTLDAAALDRLRRQPI